MKRLPFLLLTGLVLSLGYIGCDDDDPVAAPALGPAEANPRFAGNWAGFVVDTRGGVPGAPFPLAVVITVSSPIAVTGNELEATGEAEGENATLTGTVAGKCPGTVSFELVLGVAETEAGDTITGTGTIEDCEGSGTLTLELSRIGDNGGGPPGGIGGSYIGEFFAVQASCTLEGNPVDTPPDIDFLRASGSIEITQEAGSEIFSGSGTLSVSPFQLGDGGAAGGKIGSATVNFSGMVTGVNDTGDPQFEGTFCVQVSQGTALLESIEGTFFGSLGQTLFIFFVGTLTSVDGLVCDFQAEFLESLDAAK